MANPYAQGMNPIPWFVRADVVGQALRPGNECLVVDGLLLDE